jgi:hypothetical protein
MKLVMTLLARDEEDILNEQLDYHLNAGVDHVIATDHRSRDGTTEILESYERLGVLRLIRENGEFTQQGMWQTRMSRLAASEHGADWVISSDADEFWWPRGASLKEVFASVSREYGTVRGLLRNFMPIRDDAGWFAERMTVRMVEPAPMNDPATPFRPAVKVAHRGDPEAVVGEGGSHQVRGVEGALLRAWHPVEVLHFPLRSRDQCARKYEKTWTGWKQNLRGDLARARQAFEAGTPDDLWDRIALGDAELNRGLAEGWLARDTRLRDALGGGAGDVAAIAPRGRGQLADGAELDVRAHALEVAVFEEAELVRLHRWIDELATRAKRLEDGASRGRMGRSP